MEANVQAKMFDALKRVNYKIICMEKSMAESKM